VRARREESPTPHVSFDDPAWLAQERQWLDALRQGDGRAFDRLYAAYAAPLYRRVLLPRLGDPAAAEDALGETFRKFVERIDTYQDQGKGLWPYLATIAVNHAHDLHRERSRRGRALASFEAMLAPLQAAGNAPPAPDDGPERAALAAAVERALAALNPRYRKAIELRFFADREREECAMLLEVKLGTFDVLLLRALRAFRERWQEQQTSAARTAQGA
jgi:RNA polymerase sigma factor (sigma-70 family)